MNTETRESLSKLAIDIFTDFPNNKAFAKAVETRLEALDDPGLVADRKQVLFNLHWIASMYARLQTLAESPLNDKQGTELWQAMADKGLGDFGEMLTLASDQGMFGSRTDDEIVVLLGEICVGPSRHQNFVDNRPGFFDQLAAIISGPTVPTPSIGPDGSAPPIG